MTVSDSERALLAALEDGLPLVSRPFAAVAAQLGKTEAEVIYGLQRMIVGGTIRRFGVVVRHHELGYRANAMTVWDVPDSEVDEVGARMAEFPFVTLCYRRPRRLPTWRYNLFVMIHGKDRETVEGQVQSLVDDLILHDVPCDVLFSKRRFKQRGARYTAEAAE